MVDELGQGAFARVFLAQQESLAGRLVALKVTLRPTREAERLARLQHTNVVPVYSVHDAPPMQVICMPFLGRRTIADLIRVYRAEHSSRGFSARRTAGTRPARTTDVASMPGVKPLPTQPSDRQLPVGTDGGMPGLVGDPLAVVRVLAQLASGLVHAHERGILHLDLKPANVLLPDVGEPMLLDFNLSFDASTPDRDLVGGTIPYMATEQLLDLKSRGLGKIDVRTDLYSLGVMAFEMLTGTVPFPATANGMKDVELLIAARENGPPSVRALNPLVSPAVEAIVHKLLAPRPIDRYQTAEELRTDAERHLNDLPLQYATERSLRERVGKWRRRNPGLPARLAAAVFLGLAFGLGGVAHIRAEANLRAQAVEKLRAARTELDSIRLDLILPGDDHARAQGIEKAERFLSAYGLPDDPEWMTRPDFRRLPEAERAVLGAELGEMLLLLARAKWEVGHGKEGAARGEAAASAFVLNRAAARCFTPETTPRLLDSQARELATATRLDVPEPQAKAEQKRTASDLFLEAADEMGRGRYAAAVAPLKEAIAAQPGHAPAHLCLAYCLHQRGEHDRALERYEVASALLPTDPRPALFRGLVYGLKRDFVRAEEEFSRAVVLAPERPEGYRNRGLTRFRLAGEDRQRLQAAVDDLTAALTRGASPFQTRLLRAEVHDELGDEKAARNDREAVAELEPKTERDFLFRGLTRIKTQPRNALADFKAAMAINPRSLIAVQNQAHVLADKLNEPDAALAAATRASEMFPEYAPARIGRAVLLARAGNREEAHREAEKARLLSADPGVTYQAACVYALTSKTNREDARIALDFLRKAFSTGYTDVQMFRTDSDLDPLRKLPEFHAIARAVSELRLVQ